MVSEFLTWGRPVMRSIREFLARIAAVNWTDALDIYWPVCPPPETDEEAHERLWMWSIR